MCGAAWRYQVRCMNLLFTFLIGRRGRPCRYTLLGFESGSPLFRQTPHPSSHRLSPQETPQVSFNHTKSRTIRQYRKPLIPTNLHRRRETDLRPFGPQVNMRPGRDLSNFATKRSTTTLCIVQSRERKQLLVYLSTSARVPSVLERVYVKRVPPIRPNSSTKAKRATSAGSARSRGGTFIGVSAFGLPR